MKVIWDTQPAAQHAVVAPFMNVTFTSRMYEMSFRAACRVVTGAQGQRDIQAECYGLVYLLDSW
jgi:hypothetical protein